MIKEAKALADKRENPFLEASMSADKPDVLFARPLYSYSLDEVAGFCAAHKLWEAEDPDALLARIASTCRAAVTRAVFSEDWMTKLPNLGIIAVCGVGYEGVEAEAAKDRGIIVTNTPDVLTEEVADYGVALLLASARRVVAGDRYVRRRRWPKEGAMAYGQRVYGKRLGILGLGRIGMAIARRCEAFGMEIGYHNRNQRDDVPYPYFEDAVALGEWADYFIVIVPGGEGTRHLVDAAVMDAIGPGGCPGQRGPRSHGGRRSPRPRLARGASRVGRPRRVRRRAQRTGGLTRSRGQADPATPPGQRHPRHAPGHVPVVHGQRAGVFQRGPAPHSSPLNQFWNCLPALFLSFPIP